MTLNVSKIGSGTLIGRLLRAPLQLVPKDARMFVLQGPLRGARWIAGAMNHGCWLGSYEYEKQLVFSRLVKSGDTVYDVGANAGFYTLLASRLVGTAGKVVAFEPLPDNLSVLSQHLALNRVTNVDVVSAAVAASNGEASFVIGDSNAVGRLSSNGTLRVSTISLDSFVEAGGPTPSLLKIDVEGGEMDVLTGAAKVLTTVRPTIMLATHSTELHSACCRRLREFEYSLASVDGKPIDETDEILARPK